MLSSSKFMILVFPFCLCIRAKERHWLLWQPWSGLQECHQWHAWPLQPNPAIIMPSFSSIEFKQPSLGTLWFFAILDGLNPDTYPDGRIWLFGFNPYFFEHNSLSMRSTSKSLGLQGCAQMGFLVLFIMPLLGSSVAIEIPGSMKITTFANSVSFTGLNKTLSCLILTQALRVLEAPSYRA